MKTNQSSIAASSLAQVKEIRNLATIGLLIAMGVALSFLNLNLTPMLRINFKFLTSSLVGMLYGPVAGAMYGAATDVLGYLVAPSGPYFIGFTLIAMIGGVLNGYLYYQKDMTWKRIIFSRILVVFICQVVLNTWCLSLLYSKYFWGMLPARIIKNIMLLPVEVVLLYSVMKLVQRIQSRSH